MFFCICFFSSFEIKCCTSSCFNFQLSFCIYFCSLAASEVIVRSSFSSEIERSNKCLIQERKNIAETFTFSDYKHSKYLPFINACSHYFTTLCSRLEMLRRRVYLQNVAWFFEFKVGIEIILPCNLKILRNDSIWV